MLGRVCVVCDWSSLLTWDQSHSFVFGELSLASIELFGHFLMLGPLTESLKVIVDGAVQLVLDTPRTRLEVARSACLDITP